ncbi:MAG TPA: NAD-dependent epimerase/dehydratase family protein [Candidatus Cloacimonadota bacterium]|nr:NAD-dependent epimerase/dehydratase family protein [Candidatus Cloacimonadota bacterium]HPT71240.1 NAD-dependent epimerase/dehydratase family protein [Candidatus Cloacimonadota bacterium]
MKKILITGANGFVGSYLAQFLSLQGYEVTALVRHTAKCELLPANVRLIRTDYCAYDLIKAFIGQDVIIHTAATVRARKWDDYYDINVSLTEKMIEAYHQSEDPTHFIFMSSQAAAGMAQTGQQKHEDDPCTPISDYGRSKLLAEQKIRELCTKPWTIVRPASVYGPGDKDFLIFFKTVKNHFSLHIGNPNKNISLIYVNELAEFIQRVMESKESHNQIFFASDGHTYKQDDFVNGLEHVIPTWTLEVHIPDLILYPAAAFSEIGGFITKKAPVLNWQKKDELLGKNWVVSIEKAKNLLGFDPEPNLISNLQNTYKWYKQKGWL